VKIQGIYSTEYLEKSLCGVNFIMEAIAEKPLQNALEFIVSL
jgi:hypothetical protein